MKHEHWPFILALPLLAVLVLPQASAAPPASDRSDDLSTEDAILAKSLVWTICTPNRIATFENRVHVQCTAPVSGILYFAAPASDPALAARVLSVLTTALAMGGDVGILYDPADTSGAAFGCQVSDCRRIRGVSTNP